MKHLHPAHLSDDSDMALAFIMSHPFAVLAVNADNGPIMAMAPFVPDQANESSLVLLGHVARNNQIVSHADSENISAVALFRGSDAYVSADYYPSKADHGRVVPTWNYTAVEMRGQLSFETDPKAMLPYVSVLTDVMESDRATPWKVSDAPDAYISKLCRGIVGLRLEVNEITYARKLSKDKSLQDRAGVTQAFETSNKPLERRMAEEMKKDI